MKKLLSLFLLLSVAFASYAATDFGISVAGVRVTSDNKTISPALESTAA